MASKHHYYLDFFRLSVIAQFSRDASRNRLGYAWWVLEPALMLAVFYVVFGLILQRGGPGFIYDLLVGVTLWSWFSNTMQKSTASISRSAQLMQQIYIPKQLLPLISVSAEALKALILVIILLFILAITIGPSATWLWLPLILALQLLFGTACGMITAHLLPFMNDVKYIVTMVLRLAMFLSGVFYRIDVAVPEAYRDYLMLNPLATLIAEARNVLVSGSPPQLDWLLYVFAISLVLLIIGYWLIKRHDRVYPRLLSR